MQSEDAQFWRVCCKVKVCSQVTARRCERVFLPRRDRRYLRLKLERPLSRRPHQRGLGLLSFLSSVSRECLEIARRLYPDDERLLELDRGERDTDNLSPWPVVAAVGERMHHDEFMRRTLELTKIPGGRKRRLAAIGEAYLTRIRAMDATAGQWRLPVMKMAGWKECFAPC